jgi:hypothetical protein
VCVSTTVRVWYVATPARDACRVELAARARRTGGGAAAGLGRQRCDAALGRGGSRGLAGLAWECRHARLRGRWHPALAVDAAQLALAAQALQQRGRLGGGGGRGGGGSVSTAPGWCGSAGQLMRRSSRSSARLRARAVLCACMHGVRSWGAVATGHGHAMPTGRQAGAHALTHPGEVALAPRLALARVAGLEGLAGHCWAGRARVTKSVSGGGAGK